MARHPVRSLLSDEFAVTAQLETKGVDSIVRLLAPGVLDRRYSGLSGRRDMVIVYRCSTTPPCHDENHRLARHLPTHPTGLLVSYPPGTHIPCVAQTTRLPNGVEPTPPTSATTTYTVTEATHSEQPARPAQSGETQLERTTTHQPKPSPKHGCSAYAVLSCLSLILHVSPDSPPAAALIPAPCRRPYCQLLRACDESAVSHM